MKHKNRKLLTKLGKKEAYRKINLNKNYLGANIRIEKKGKKEATFLNRIIFKYSI